MPICNIPILEVILRQMEKYGFADVIISTGYLDGLIRAYLESSEHPDLNIRFSHENEPLGTVGPLHLIDGLEETFLVMNGDVLTDINYQRLVEYHREKQAVATIATFQRDTKIDFGVLVHDAANKIRGFTEKPIYHFEVSMGIYVFEREILAYVPKNTPFGFDDLMYAMIAQDAGIYSYPYSGYWLDIGRPDDYERSIDEFEKNKEKFL